MGAIIFVSILVYIVLFFFIGWTFFDIVKMKGHYVNKQFYSCPYFWWVFLTGIIGMLMVIALPDRKNTSTSNTVDSSELPEI